tara:strand:+ start:691 stop:1032 length:342 start_codon:yes stop_codon:yes gene_type:complete
MNIANNLINFWEGKTSLWKSYWIIGELINSLFILLMINIEIRVFKNSYILDNLPFLDFGNLNFITKIFILIWTIFITVGIWRSAEAYKGKFLWIVLTLIVLSYRLFTLRIMLI